MTFSRLFIVVIFLFSITGISGLANVSNAASSHKGKLQPEKDYHSFANTDEVILKHIDLDLAVDFDKKQMRGHAIMSLKYLTDKAETLVLDTRALNIEKVEVRKKTEAKQGKWKKAKFLLRKADPALGSALAIALKDGVDEVKVHYSTSPEASGLQWLTPAQTAGKKHPFLFSQAQAIHARSFIPLQDTPQVRVTYNATIRTPKALRAVMSAENDPEAERNGVYTFKMPQAIPSYLIAIAVGDLEFKAMGKRTGVYAEAEILNPAAAEFADTESMLEETEKKFGPYSWGRYDLLILPPSFPFGGMENPRLSFITPTVIAGDKSLVALIAHELAHSWSGNTVTNATWRDLWLNEGFTTYLTYRIMEIIYGERRFKMESVLGYQDLEAAVASVKKDDQRLAVDVRGRDPDDAFSNIPYEKGSLLLTEIEHKIGREAFDEFLKTYFAKYQFQSLHTEEFLDYLNTHLIKRYPDKLSLDRVKQWVYESGFPADAPKPQSDAFTIIEDKRERWLAGGLIARKIRHGEWTVHEWLFFLNNLPEQLSASQMAELDRVFELTESKNNEIAHSWLLIAIRNDYQPAYPRLEKYLVEIGRRKLITPLYDALMKTKKGAVFAKRVYKKARPGYHPLAQGTMDKIVYPEGK